MSFTGGGHRRVWLREVYEQDLLIQLGPERRSNFPPARPRDFAAGHLLYPNVGKKTPAQVRMEFKSQLLFQAGMFATVKLVRTCASALLVPDRGCAAPKNTGFFGSCAGRKIRAARRAGFVSGRNDQQSRGWTKANGGSASGQSCSDSGKASCARQSRKCRIRGSAAAAAPGTNERAAPGPADQCRKTVWSARCRNTFDHVR